MTLTVEDGSLVTSANSYVSVVDAEAYATARGLTFTADTEQLLVQAMDYLEQQNFIGIKYTDTQALQWPRSYVYIDTYLFAYDDIPQQLINAQVEIALAIDAGFSPLSNITPSIKRKKLDTLEIEYQAGSGNNTYVKKINNWLRKLIQNSGSGNVIKVSKA